MAWKIGQAWFSIGTPCSKPPMSLGCMASPGYRVFLLGCPSRKSTAALAVSEGIGREHLRPSHHSQAKVHKVRDGRKAPYRWDALEGCKQARRRSTRATILYLAATDVPDPDRVIAGSCRAVSAQGFPRIWHAKPRACCEEGGRGRKPLRAGSRPEE